MYCLMLHIHCIVIVIGERIGWGTATSGRGIGTYHFDVILGCECAAVFICMPHGCYARLIAGGFLWELSLLT